MKKIVFSLFFMLTLFTYTAPQTEFKIIESRNTLDAKNLLLDINSCSKEDMLKSGISKSYVEKIIEYRDITGGFQNISDLKRISGIGEKTFNRLKPYFSEPQNVVLKKFNINTANEKTLKYYGFTKKEIKKIKMYKKKNNIRNSYELKEILPGKIYDRVKDLVEY